MNDLPKIVIVLEGLLILAVCALLYLLFIYIAVP